MTYSGVDTFYVSELNILASPSRQHGVEKGTEEMLRRFGCDLVQEAGILLRLPQAVMATGQVLLHRFYCKKSFCDFDVRKLAIACLWLASKVGENTRRAQHVLNVEQRIQCRNDGAPFVALSAEACAARKKELVAMEVTVLRELGFVCHVDHPHKFVLSYLLSLEASPELMQEGWSLANDSLRTTLCVQFKSEVVACGVVYAAARRRGVALPESPPWWKVFDADERQIRRVCGVLAELYRQPKPVYAAVFKVCTPAVCADLPARVECELAKELATAAAPSRLRLTGDVARVSTGAGMRGDGSAVDGGESGRDKEGGRVGDTLSCGGGGEEVKRMQASKEQFEGGREKGEDRTKARGRRREEHRDNGERHKDYSSERETLSKRARGEIFLVTGSMSCRVYHLHSSRERRRFSRHDRVKEVDRHQERARGVRRNY